MEINFVATTFDMGTIVYPDYPFVPPPREFTTPIKEWSIIAGQSTGAGGRIGSTPDESD
jgi:hypothetical protein